MYVFKYTKASMTIEEVYVHQVVVDGAQLAVVPRQAPIVLACVAVQDHHLVQQCLDQCAVAARRAGPVGVRGKVLREMRNADLSAGGVEHRVHAVAIGHEDPVEVAKQILGD